MKHPLNYITALPDFLEMQRVSFCWFITQGLNLEDLREIMTTREEYRERREANEAGLMKTLGTYSPAFGMVGTLIGLIMIVYGESKKK